MRLDKAPHVQALKKRVDRFFNSETSVRTEVHDFIGFFIKNKINIFSFGGLVRDIGLFSVRDFDSDVDLVVDIDRETLCHLIDMLDKTLKIRIKENKFGGFRINKNDWCFDIWCARDTWAIKENHVEYTGIESLLKTTFLNWDSVLFNLNDKRLICEKNYFDNLTSGELDLVLSYTPNELGALVRVMRAIYGKGVRKLHNRAIDFIYNGFCNYNKNEIIKYERLSYGNPFLDGKKLNKIKRYIMGCNLDGSYSKQLNIKLDVNIISLESNDLFETINNELKKSDSNHINETKQLWLDIFD